MSIYFGYHTMLDCNGCDIAAMKDKTVCYNFIKELVPAIDMIAAGEPIIEYLLPGEDKAGYSIMQLITTSSITAHLMEVDGTAYFDVFSCKEYDIEVAKQIVTKYFNPKNMRVNYITRDAR